MDQDIRFCRTSDGVRIAYAINGHGPLLLISLGWVTHIELTWQNPVWRKMFELLSEHFTIVHYDKRGVGLSDRDVKDVSVDSRLLDLQAVTKQFEGESFFLFGLSEGGPITIRYAAENAGRVIRLALYGSFANGSRMMRTKEAGEALAALVRAEWSIGSLTLANIFVPNAAPEELEAFKRNQRTSATADIAADLLLAGFATDVTQYLEAVVAPTLVVHARRDKAVRFDLGREVAAGIPNARLLPLETNRHGPDVAGMQGIVEAVIEFFGEDDFWARAEQARRSAAPVVAKGEASAVTDSARLSAREVEVLRLVALGKGNQEIADELVISLNTAIRHVSNIFTKIGARNRTEAGAYAFQHGLDASRPDQAAGATQQRSPPLEGARTPSGTVTILFLDIVDSTALTEKLGDAAFRELSRDLETVLRTAIREHGGSLVEGKVLGDGVMATFASASRAIEAALACNEAAAKTELRLHLGLHAGDVIDEGDNVYGGAVNLASRVCAISEPGEVLVSETVRALARTSAGVRFEDRGVHELKGIEEPQRLFAVRAI